MPPDFVLVLSPLVLILFAYPAVRLIRPKASLLNRLLVSAVLSTAVVAYGTNVVAYVAPDLLFLFSRIIFGVGIFAVVFAGYDIVVSFSKSRAVLNRYEILAVIVAIAVAIRYLLVLQSKAVFDWDAATLYLPLARQIAMGDSSAVGLLGFVQLVKSSGISYIYAWIYSVSGNLLAESFRLVPLAYLFGSICAVYALTRKLLDRNLAAITVLVFLLLPFHDLFLQYSSFYPDIAYNMMILSALYFFVKYAKSSDTLLGFMGSLAIGVAAFLKVQTLFFGISVLLFFTFLWRRDREPLGRFGLGLLGSTFGLLYLNGLVLTKTTALPLTDPTYITATILMAFISFCVIRNIQGIRQSLSPSAATSRSSTTLMILLAAGVLSLAPYAVNLFRTGSLIWTTGLPGGDIRWALESIAAAWPVSASFSIVEGVAFGLGLILLIPALGSGLLLVKIVGFLSARTGSMRLLLLWFGGYLVGYAGWKFLGLIFDEPVLFNPRNFVPLAPFFSVLIAIGFVKMTSAIPRSARRIWEIWFVIVLISGAFFQSNFLFKHAPTLLQALASAVLTPFGLEWSSVAVGQQQHLFELFIFSLVASLALLIVYVPLYATRRLKVSIRFSW